MAALINKKSALVAVLTQSVIESRVIKGPLSALNLQENSTECGATSSFGTSLCSI